MPLKLSKGTIIPDLTTIRKAAAKLRKDLASDKSLKAAWVKNPRLVLGARGFPYDVQTELIREAGRRITAADCDNSCICTGCSLTTWDKVAGGGRL